MEDESSSSASSSQSVPECPQIVPKHQRPRASLSPERPRASPECPTASPERPRASPERPRASPERPLNVPERPQSVPRVSQSVPKRHQNVPRAAAANKTSKSNINQKIASKKSSPSRHSGSLGGSILRRTQEGKDFMLKTNDFGPIFWTMLRPSFLR